MLVLGRLLAALLITHLTLHQALGADLAPAGQWEGKWEGHLSGGIEFQVVLTVDVSGEWSGSISSPDWGERDWPLQNLSVRDSTLSFDVRSHWSDERGSFVCGFLGTRVVGRYTYAGKTYTAVLRRGQRPNPAGARVRIEPLPYQIEPVKLAVGQVTLTGGLLLPARAGDGPVPSALLLSGSEPRRWRPAIPGDPNPSSWYWALADQLCRRGIAVLRLDSRGTGDSGGRFEDAPLDALAEDAAAAVTFLSQHPSLHGGRVSVIGHSEGADVATIAATRSDRVSALVLLSSGGLPTADVYLDQSRLRRKALGLPWSADEPRARFERRLYDAARSAVPSGELEAGLLRWADAEGILTSEGAGSLKKAVAEASTPHARSALRYRPAEYLVKVGVPVLTINGGKDILVGADQNVPELRRALDQCPSRDVTVRVMPDLSHALYKTANGFDAAAGGREHADPLVTQTVSNWLIQRLRPGHVGAKRGGD